MKRHMKHGRHVACWDTDDPLPVDSCHWEDCGKGVSDKDRLCFHKEKS